MIRLQVSHESWPIRGSFAISRGSKNAADVVLVELSDGANTGRGECVPYAHYGESIAGVRQQIEAVRGELEKGAGRDRIQSLMSAGAARNAVDCALWDLEAKATGTPAAVRAGVHVPAQVRTAYTLSLDTPENMRAAAERLDECPILKLKLAGDGDLQRVAAVREGAPRASIIVDANEGWGLRHYRDMTVRFKELGVVMIEQPFPAAEDAVLADLDHPLLVCADEACHDRGSLPALLGRYDVVNIKLDKTGGLTEALALKREAVAMGFEIMIGCMLATSLAMAPALLLAEGAAFVDLDGPLWLAGDRPTGLDIDGTLIAAPDPALWG